MILSASPPQTTRQVNAPGEGRGAWQKALTGRRDVPYYHRHRAPWGPALSREIESMEVSAMAWETPQFVEVKMDAEINSYQDDFGGEQDDRF